MHSEPADLWGALSLFRQRVLDQMQDGLVALGLDLSAPQSLALGQLWEAGPLTIGALQSKLRRSQATTSQLVTQLELRGLVERTDDPADARRTLVRVSKEGRRLMGRLETLRRRSFERVLGGLPPAVRRQLEQALLATVRALEVEEEKS